VNSGRTVCSQILDHLPWYEFRSGKLHHLGFRGSVARTTLPGANESRHWRLYAGFAQVLIRMAPPLSARDPIGVQLDQRLYALHSTTIKPARFHAHQSDGRMEADQTIRSFLRIPAETCPEREERSDRSPRF